ncbi:MAG: ShlB/FhaC/HecB family hemolysin secretion/activation protein [Scytolyngbya sp. HA4215-MV1]|nr:ShlB/FhaC/HecB family hemolysin secretion/activation protein [Scytolyngbya sp. HA4215-MV1]
MNLNLLAAGAGFLYLSCCPVNWAAAPSQPQQPPFPFSQIPVPEALLDQPDQGISAEEKLAQTLPPPGSSSDPLLPKRPDIEPLPQTLPSPQAPLLNPQVPPPSQSPADTEARVQVRQIIVRGNTVLSQAEIDQATAFFIGRSLTFEELLQIRTAITNLYIEKGYATSGAFLPPQDVADGIIEIQAVEGELEKVEIQGLTHLKAPYVRDRIALAASPPLNLRRLEAALQLLQRDPLLVRVDAELKAGTSPGRSVLSLRLKEAPPLSVSLQLANEDAPSVGSVRESGTVEYTNLLGLGDRFSAEIGFTEGVDSYDFRYAVPLNARDGTLTLRYQDSKSKIIEDPFSVLDIRGKTRAFSVDFRQPLHRTPTNEFALDLSLDFRRSRTFLFDDIPFSFSLGPQDGESKVSVLRFSQDWIDRTPRRVLAARSQFSLGLDAFGATINDDAPDGRFFSWVGQFQWVQALGDVIGIARVTTQLTGDSLLPLEQFSVGGIDTVRGYRQNQRVADNGIVGSLELRVPIMRDDRLGVLQLAPFFDIGTVWNNDKSLSLPNPTTLLSLGLGLHWDITPYFSAQLDWGIPLNKIKDQGDTLQDNGIVFSIRLRPF